MLKRVFLPVIVLSLLVAANCCLLSEYAHASAHNNTHASCKTSGDTAVLTGCPIKSCPILTCSGPLFALSEQQVKESSNDFAGYLFPFSLLYHSLFPLPAGDVSEGSSLENAHPLVDCFQMLASLTRAAFAPPIHSL